MRIAISLILVAAATAASAQMYRWTDASGRTHFTDTPPPADAKSVHRQQDVNFGSASSAAEPYALQEARKRAPVTLYSTAGCEACDLARTLLNTRGIPFREVSVGDEDSLAALKSAVGSHSVPALIVGGTLYKGFEESAFHQLLDNAGYPKSGILPARSQPAPSPAASPPKAAPAAAEASPARGPYSPR